MSEFVLSEGINKDKIFMMSSNNLTTQWAPDFYHKERLKYLNIFLNPNYKFNIQRLNKIINISSKKSVASHVETYIGMANIESNTGKYISSEKDKGKGDCNVFKSGDVLFGKLRPYLNKVYLAEFDGGCTSEFIVMDSFDEDMISNKFLSIFLLLDCVVNQTKHMMTGNTLPRLQTFDIENLIIPILPINIQKDIIDLMNKAYTQKKQKEKQAKDLLESIDNYLLKELGITLPEVDNRLEKRIFEVKLSEVSSSRFDSNFYQSKYTEYYKNLDLSKYLIKTIKDISIFISSGATPKAGGDGYEKNGNIYFLRLTNFDTNLEINLDKSLFIKPYIHNNMLNRSKLKFGDILFGIAGSIGKIVIFDKNKNANINQAIAILRFQSHINKFYIAFLLNSTILKYQINQHQRPVAQPNMNITELQSLKIPLPRIEKQNEIANHIQSIRDEAKQLKTEAVQDLEQAKQKVEKMILGQ